MERKIVRHAVGAAGHEAALDAEFRQGQRVVTIDGVAGRIQFVTGSFAPGVAEYQVVLDNGMGGGTYTASQLRAVPDSYRAPSGPHGNLPAGVTAALEAEAGEIHLASDDYPEMGQVLHERPDPAGQFQIIGSRHQADAYAQGHDARDDDDNGGEADTGMYWEAPANQQWRDENLGEPPEPEIQDVPGYGPEQFEQQFGKISTTINGTEIDGHGDAPGHGSRPRAQEPNAYDAESTEGQGDPDQDKPLNGVSEYEGKSATSGMFPGGVYAGDSFGMSFGAAFGMDQDNWAGWNDYAADKPADPHPDHDSDEPDELRYPEEHLQAEGRVPWTGHERTELHGWANGAGTTEGDFVPSGNFTGRHPVQPLEEPAPEAIEQQLQAQAAVHPDVFCAVRHPGECLFPPPMQVHGESVRHPRPRGFHSEIHPVDQATQQRKINSSTGLTPTHMIRGYLNGQHVGSLHYQQSDDGKAAYVTNLETYKTQGRGVGSAMMDDLYSHAHHTGMWINHGQRTPPGMNWWNSYREPHPEHNAHNAMPNQGIPATPEHPAVKSWQHYWDPREVAGDMHFNAESDPAGKHEPPLFNPHLYDETADYGRHWKNSTKQLPREVDPFADEAERDAKRDMAASGHGADEFHGWGELAHTGSLTAEAIGIPGSPDPLGHQALHLHMMHKHKWNLRRGHEAGDGIWDEHRRMHEEGGQSHDHDWALESKFQPLYEHKIPRDNKVADPRRGGTSSNPFADAPRHMWQPGGGSTQPGSMLESKTREFEPHLHSPDSRAVFSSKHSLDHHYERHLMDAHGYSPADVERVRAHGLHDMHGVLHQSGLANHSHGDLAAELEAGARQHHDSQVADQFGRSYSRPQMKTKTRPELGGHSGEFDPDQLSPARVRAPEEAYDPAALHAYYSSRQAEGGVRVRTNGPNDFTFHHVPDDAEDPGNSLDDGEPDERPDELDAEQDENGLENGEAPGEAPAAEGEEEDTETDQEVPGAAGDEPPGNLPAGVQPPRSPSKRPPQVPQSGHMPPETWPLATAPVQERPLPLSQGGKPSPSTKRSNPVKLELPGAGGGPEVDGEKPGAEDKGAPKEAALAAFTAAAGSEAFRFEFTAAWRDVVAKAKRLRKGNRVRITHASAGLVVGEVGGDHDVYECGIQRPAGRPQTIQHWACGCPWASFHQDASYPGRLNGRPCSHVYALQLEASSRYSRSHGGEVYQDPSADELGVPHQVVVKSMPPWGAGGWAQTWLAPAASKTGGRHERPEPEELAGVPEDDTDWGYYEGGDEPNPWGQGRHRVPSHEAALALVAAGEDPADVELLARVAGIDLSAAANDPWGGSNYATNPPPKPYGATSPPDPDQDPGSYGPLAGPDPEGWAEIPDTGLSQPFQTTSGMNQDLEQPAPYQPPADAAGPYSAGDPADPEGLTASAASMDEEGTEYERHLVEQHGVPADWATRYDHQKHLLDHDDVNRMAHRGDPLPDGYQPHPYQQTAWEARHEEGRWPDAGHSHSFTGSAVQIALTAGIAELEANAVGEAERLRAGIDGTMGDAQDVPHEFHGNTPYCPACGLEAGAGIHQRDGAQAELHTTPEPALPEVTATGYALDAETTGGGPGMSEGDEDLSPDDTSMQTIGAVDPVAQFQATAAARLYAGEGGAPAGDGDVAAAAREYLAKTADVLPDHEAAALISEGRGTRARNLDMLKLEGTHYEAVDDEVSKRGLSLDDCDDDLVVL